MNNLLTKIYLGIDWGEKRIGLALADSETKLATPFKTVEDVGGVIETINIEKIDMIVIGKPVRIMDYDLDITNKKYNNFLKDLKEKINLPVESVDERLSSKAADALVGNKKTKANRDEIAAMLILQSYLDKI